MEGQGGQNLRQFRYLYLPPLALLYVLLSSPDKGLEPLTSYTAAQFLGGGKPVLLISAQTQIFVLSFAQKSQVMLK